MRNLLLTAFLAAGFLAAPHPAKALGPGPDHPPLRMEAFQALFTEEQNQKLEALLKSSRSGHEALMEAARVEHDALRDLLEDPAATDAQIKAQVMKEAEARAALMVQDAALNRAVRKLATAEQLSRIDALTARQAARHAKMHAAMEKCRKENPVEE
jgi:Spy/CpxP family protein refolding chaperone